MEKRAKKIKRMDAETLSMEDLRNSLNGDRCEMSVVSNFKLPECGGNSVAVPHSILRSAIFSPIQSRDRVFLHKAYIWAQSGYDITYTGEQLNQDDLRVWETILFMTKRKYFGTRFTLSAYEILKQMNKTLNKSTYKALSECMVRLTNHRITIAHEKKQTEYVGGLISSINIKSKITQFTFSLDADMYELWNINDWTRIDLKFLDNIKRKPFTEKLYGFIVSHKTVIDLSYSYYQDLTTNQHLPCAKFKQKMKKSLTELLEYRFLRSFELADDVVKIVRA